jgi:hypothetical protein
MDYSVLETIQQIRPADNALALVDDFCHLRSPALHRQDQKVFCELDILPCFTPHSATAPIA